MKVEVEVSEEDVNFLQELFYIRDVSKFVAAFLHETCRAVREAKAMDKAGVKLGEKEIDAAGVEAAQKAMDAACEAVCVGCGEPLRFDLKIGWVHMDGELYKKRPDGSDDHCAMPRRKKE